VNSKRFLSACVLLLAACFLVSGCSPAWRKKFIRRHSKETGPPPAILVLQPDPRAVFPADIRYREHYAFWKSWHSELLLSLGQIHKRDIRYMDGVIGELRAMHAVLSGRSADRLREILIELSDLQDQWERSPDTWQMPAAHRTRLEKIQREISKDFQYGDVKEAVVADPEPSQQP